VQEAAVSLAQSGTDDVHGHQLTNAVLLLKSVNADLDALMAIEQQGRAPLSNEQKLKEKEHWLFDAFTKIKLTQEQGSQLAKVLGGQGMQDLSMALKAIGSKLQNVGDDSGTATDGRLRKMGLFLSDFEQVIRRFAASPGGRPEVREPGNMTSARFAPAYAAIEAAFGVRVGVEVSETGATKFANIDPSKANAPRDARGIFGPNADAHLLDDLHRSARGEKNLANFHVLKALDRYQAGRFHTVWGARRFMKQLQKDAAFVGLVETSKRRDVAFANALHKLEHVNSSAQAKQVLDQLRTHIQNAVFENSKVRFLSVNGIPV